MRPNTIFLWNAWDKTLGLLFLALGEANRTLRGYSRTRPFGTQAIARCVNYDVKVVDEWIGPLADCTRSGEDPIGEARIPELGPGADLGVAAYLLAKGVGPYGAVDA